jgi:small subunit ribosomal protein S11
MARPIPKYNLRNTKQLSLIQAIIHIQGTFNNIIVTVTNVVGQVLFWYSAGMCGFKGDKKSTPFAAQTVAENAIRFLVDHRITQAQVMINGPSRGRDNTLRAIRYSGIALWSVRDVTPMPHNGCRPPAKRRV